MIRIAGMTAVALCLGLCGAAVGAAPPAAQAAFDYGRLVDAVVARYHLPGIAVGVIENGKVVYTHFTGTRQSGRPIDGDTLFKIGSNTKAMTVTTLARLAQQGKLDWRGPVTRYLPDFRMYDPWVTRNIQVGDLVSHHSGFHPFAGDLMLWPHPSHFTPADVARGMRYLKPVYSFRAGYSYDNVLFVVAGEVAAKIGNASYAQMLRQEVFDPLGMSRCQIGTWNRSEVGNVARPHVSENDRWVAVPAVGSIHHATTMDAAGGVACSLKDMLTWAGNWLAPTASQLEWLSPEQRRREWQIYTPVPISRRQLAWNDTRIYGNGHGWFIGDADGQLTVSHTGVVSGMRAAVVLLPNLKSGFVVLINSDADSALAVMDEVLLKHLAAPHDERTVAWYADSLAQFDAHERIPVPDTSSREPATPASLKGSLGVWQDPWFGKVRICPKGDGVAFVSEMSPLLTGKVMRVGKRYLVQWEHDTPAAWLDFPTEAQGTLHMGLVDRNQDPSWDFEDLAFKRSGNCP